MTMFLINQEAMLGLDTSFLVDIDVGHKLLPEAKQAFMHMQSDAKNHNVDIQICSSYRSFEKQLSIWNRKWHGELPLYTLDGNTLDHESLTDIEKIHAIMLWSALPGASRHHWGTDFDVYDKTQVEKQAHNFQLVPEEYEGSGPCKRLSDWLQKYSQDYDFYLPYAEYNGGVAREPWHLSYKPIAKLIEEQLSESKLYETLANSDIMGKRVVLTLLPQLIKRYTFNQGN